MTTNNISSATLWLAWGGEAISVIYDCRWLIVLCVIVMLADLWWAYSEHKYRENKGETSDWRASKAIRRTSMKLVDYLTLFLVGVIFGLAVFEPLGWANHTICAVVGMGIGIMCDISSIFGHICVVREVDKKNIISIIIKVIANVIKRKNQDIGEAIESLTSKTDKNGED